MNTNKGSTAKQSGNDVEGCRFGSTQYACISAIQCNDFNKCFSFFRKDTKVIVLQRPAQFQSSKRFL